MIQKVAWLYKRFPISCATLVVYFICMKFIGKILVTALAALIAAKLLPGVDINSGVSAILVAVVLALLNAFVKPVLIFFTIPVTIITFGLFLLVINVVIIKWTAGIVDGFTVDNWFAALLFGFLLSIVTSLLEKLIGNFEKKESN